MNYYKNACICIVLNIPGVLFSFTIVTYCPEWFSKYSNSLESQVYELLLKEPLEAPCTYVAVPWKWFLSHHKENISFHFNQLEKIHVNNGFTVCQHQHHTAIIDVCKKIGVTIIFTPHAPLQQPDTTVKLLPIPYVALNTATPSTSKDIFYSFIGTATSLMRKNIFSMQWPHDVLIKERPLKKPFSDVMNEEYRSILARSRFSLCPPGTGIGTFRFWESLAAGAIPVLLSDNLALPPEFNWSNAIIRISSDDLASIDSIIRSIPLLKEKKMRKVCLEIYKLSSGKHLIKTIQNYFSFKRDFIYLMF